MIRHPKRRLPTSPEVTPVAAGATSEFSASGTVSETAVNGC